MRFRDRKGRVIMDIPDIFVVLASVKHETDAMPNHWNLRPHTRRFQRVSTSAEVCVQRVYEGNDPQDAIKGGTDTHRLRVGDVLGKFSNLDGMQSQGQQK